MVWPFGKGSKQTAEQEPVVAENKQEKQKIFMEDVPPKFETQPQVSPQESRSQSKEVKKILSELTWADFQPANLLEIPCFRDAGLAGFSCLFVFSTVMFLYHKDIRKATNWGFGGLMLGSTFAWEQCNAQRKKSQLAVQMAQERFRQRQSKQSKDD
ncbi:hypothetical protein OGAPHI_002514 [Ogataea philodendri]|uniref:Cytochrome c oxidase assembly protein COX20, mitochondrial n=1 Tax=Ogataea philodendri TaxID=1378263 RepID=A0A9P8PCI9_9ASCO|nr:uncharacterized protein OGAPHI_002514 [Ogataea philodendri]KAH3668759.1 hypothetical protein OGAPHI_002514 [Ogataea philodendri]